MSHHNKVTDVFSLFAAMKRVLAAEAPNLSLRMDPTCTQPCTDMMSGVIYLPEFDPYWPNARIQQWLGEGYHEIGHHQAEVVDILDLMTTKRLSYNSLLGRIINILEDYRQEFVTYNKLYRGASHSLSFMQGEYCKQGLKSLEARGVPSEPDMRLFTEVLCWAYEIKSEWMPDLVVPSQDLSKIVNYSHHRVHDDELRRLVTAEDVYKLAMKLIDSSPDHSAEEEEKKSNKRHDKAEKAKEAKAKGKSESSDKEGKESEDEATAKRVKPGEGEDGERLEEDMEVTYKDLLGHDHGADFTVDSEDGDSHMRIKYDHEPANDYLPNPKQEEKDVAGDNPKPRAKGAIRDHVRKGSKLANACRRLFQSQTQTQTQHYKTRGRLDKRDLYRVPTGSADVFYNKTQRVDPKGTAIMLLCDFSGSMAGNKYYVASAAATLMCEALKPLQVPVYVAGFTERRKVTVHYNIKKWEEMPSQETLINKFASAASSLAMNADGESILWAYNKLQRRPEQRKIMIVLSDGQPCAHASGDCFTYTKDVIHSIRSKVECYGIGILDRTVKDLYPEYTILHDTNQLEETLFNVVKTKIFK